MIENFKQNPEIFTALPKVDLHRHLEGSLRLSTMIDIAASYDLDLRAISPKKLQALVQVMPDDPHTYQNFLSKFKTLRKFYISAEIIQRVTQEAIQDAGADNVRYLELRFTPVALGNQRNIPPGEVIDLVIDAVQKTSRQAGIKVGLIVSVNRHESVEMAEAVISAAAGRITRGIVGVDLAGDEVNYSALPFASLFKDAKNAGLDLTIHAGEWGGAENVREAIEVLEADRIGHGVRVLEDAETIALAAERGTVFEVCPTSNYHSGVFPSIWEHPLTKMIDAGLTVTLNTDDPGISAIDLSNEYLTAVDQFDMAISNLRDLVVGSARNAFLNHGANHVLADNIKNEFDQVIESFETKGDRAPAIFQTSIEISNQ